MIANDEELEVTLQRIVHFQHQVAHLRKVESNPVNFHASASGFLAEIDRMQLEVREYLSIHPGEQPCAGAHPEI
jgi:hypothetical protein